MNAPAKIDRTQALRADVQQVSAVDAPILKDAKPCLDWRVVIFGGNCPRRGFAFEPLEFCYPRSNSFETVSAKVRDKAAAQFRTHYAIMAPRELAAGALFDAAAMRSAVA